MKTPNGNDYEVFDNKIHAAINGVKYEPFDSLDEVDAAYSKLVFLCKECQVQLDVTRTCRNSECSLYNIAPYVGTGEEDFNFKVLMSTTPEIPGLKIKKIIRFVFASSS